MAASVSTRAETGRRDARICGKRIFGDAQPHGLTRHWIPAGFDYTTVLFAELELVGDFLGTELGVANVLDFHPTHHLARDYFEVLVIDVDAPADDRLSGFR
jgi:hypothetical protein